MSTNPYADQPKRKMSLLKKLLIIGGGLFLGLILFVGCTAVLVGTGDSEPSTTETVTGGEPQTEPSITETETGGDTSSYTVVLEAESTSEATVMYGPAGSSSTKNLAPGETFSQTIENADRSEWYDVSVSESTYTDETAKVTCRIIVNGKTVDEQTGTGAGAYTNCSTL